MTMNAGSRVGIWMRVCAVATLGATAGCQSPADERVGEIMLSVTAAPSGVGCLRVIVASPWGVDSKTFAVSAGATTMGSMAGLPLGAVSVRGEAFASGCSGVNSSSVPAWVSDPVGVTLVSGSAAQVSLIMRIRSARPAGGQIGVSVDWNTTGSLPTVAALFPVGSDGSLDGRLVSQPCNENNTFDDCASAGAFYRGAVTSCTGATPLTVLHTYPVAGTSGATYRVSMHFYGIMSSKNYGTGVTREATVRPGNQNTGANPSPWASAPAGHTFPASDAETYEIHVDNQNNQEVAVYYLNADTAEGHFTYVINHTKQISVIGGGRIRVRTFDRNCRQIKNCGATSGFPCDTKANARLIDVSGANPAPANASATVGGLLQPNLVTTRNANNAGQWFLLDVVSVDSVM